MPLQKYSVVFYRIKCIIVFYHVQRFILQDNPPVCPKSVPNRAKCNTMYDW